MLMQFLKKRIWSPYLAGAGIGLLSWLVFYFPHKALGASSAFVNFAGFLESIFIPLHFSKNNYLTSLLTGSPLIDWQLILVFFIVIGSMISAKLSRSSLDYYPSIWLSRFGKTKKIHAFTSITGGFIVLFGARLAGGCTSGLGISAGLKLATSSWIYLCSLFVSGIIVAHLLYKKQAGK